MKSSRIFGLDLLRACAIMLVLFDHARLFFVDSIGPSVHYWEAGDIGVDLFFVLSGFLIGGILLRDLEEDDSIGNLLRFWSRRWWRTLPNYYLFLLLNVIVYMHIGGYRFRVRPFIFFTQSMLGTPIHAFGESWSLCIEEWFYLTFPLVAFSLVYAIRLRGGFLAALATVAAFSAITRIVMVCLLDGSFGAVQHATICRMDSLIVGVFAAYAAKYFPALWQRARRPLLWIGLLLLTVGLTCRLFVPLNSTFMRLAYFEFVALAVVCLLPFLSTWMQSSSRLQPVIVQISLTSYSIYLSNRLLRELVLAYIPPNSSPASYALAAFIWLAMTCAASLFCYHFYEKRVTKLRDIDWSLLRPNWSPKNTLPDAALRTEASTSDRSAKVQD